MIQSISKDKGGARSAHIAAQTLATLRCQSSPHGPADYDVISRREPAVERSRRADPGARIGASAGSRSRALVFACEAIGEGANSAMKSQARKGPERPGQPGRADFSDPAVDAVFSAYPAPLKARLLALRRLIFDTARTTKGVGALQETLKWGQPSYLTPETKSGSTIRIDQVKSAADQYAVYFHCQTDLVETFRELYPTRTALWRQPQHPARREGRASASRRCAIAWRWR